MTHQQHPFVWDTTASNTALIVERHRVSVPEPIAPFLAEVDGDLSSSRRPAADLLMLDARLQRRVHRIDEQWRASAATAVDAQTQADALHSAPWSVRSWQRPRGCDDALAAALDHRDRLACAASATGDALQVLRHWITDTVIPALHAAEPSCALDADTRLLANAASGWERGAAAPPTVVVFDSVAAFVAADSRREVATEWGGQYLAGDRIGARWRCDATDDLDVDTVEEIPDSGRWQIGINTTTGEVFAHLTDPPHTVWLLASGLDTLDTIRVLAPLLARIHEPNSLVLAAHAVATATPRRPEPIRPRPPRTSADRDRRTVVDEPSDNAASGESSRDRAGRATRSRSPRREHWPS